MFKKIVLPMVLVCFVFIAKSQVRGDLDTTTSNVSFVKGFTNVELDPNPKIGLNYRKKVTDTYNTLSSPTQFGSNVGAEVIRQLLAANGFSIPSEVYNIVNGVGDLASVSINPRFSVGGSMKYGGYFEVNSISNADIDIDYPVEVDVTFPAPNTFACGDEIVIQTSYLVKQKPNMMKITPPFYEMEIGPVLEDLKIEAKFGLSVSACIGVKLPKVGCTGYSFSWGRDVTPLSYGIPLPPALNPLPPLVLVCEDAFRTTAKEADLINCLAPSAAKPFVNLGQIALDAYNNSRNPKTNYGFGTFTNNLVTIASPDLPTGGPTIPEMSGAFKKITNSNMSYSSLDAGKRLKLSGSSSDIAKMQIDLISLLEYAKIPTGLSLGGGLGSIDIGDIAPTFNVDQDMDFEFKPIVHLTVDLGVVMDYQVFDDNLGTVSSGTNRYVNLLAGQKIIAQYPDALSNPTEVRTTSDLDGNFSTTTTQKYFSSYDINFLQLEVGSIDETLYSTTIGKSQLSGSPQKIQDHTFNLTGFDQEVLNKFTLDPENPGISIDYIGIEKVLNIGGGERAVVYQIDFSNSGDVKLNNSQVKLDLDEVFGTASSFEVQCSNSDDVQTNTSYDGYSDINLLASNETLEVDENAGIQILVIVKPEISEINNIGCFDKVEYSAYTQAFGTSPIGTDVQSNIYQCTDQRTADDIVVNVDLGASVIDQITDYTIYGWDEVKFDKAFSLSMGNVGSSDDVIFENVSQKRGPYVEIIGDVHAGDQLFLQGESKLIVDYVQTGEKIKSPNRKSDIDETGAISQKSSCVSTFNKPTLVYMNTSKTKHNVKKNDSLSLSAGNFNEIKLNEGSVLKLSAGTYYINRLVFMGDNAKLKVDNSSGEVNIHILKWQPLQRDYLSFINKELNGNAVNYYYHGVAPAKFEYSLVQGNIIAPSAEIEFGDGSVLEGTCYANKVNFRRLARFIGPEYLEQVDIISECLNDNSIASYEKLSLEKLQKEQIVERFNQYFESENIESKDNSWINAFPNPTENSILVQSKYRMNQIVITNYLGQEVINIQPNTKIESLNLESHNIGVYFINVTTDFGSETTKIIKK